MTLISISASSNGPVAKRQGDLIISGREVAYGGFSSLLGYTSTANPQDLDKRDIYLLGITDGGLQLARSRVEVLTDFSKYRFWDPVQLTFINTPPKLDEKDYKKIYLPGSFTYGSVFHSPYFNTFIMVYFNKFVDSTFCIRFLDLNNPIGQDPIWPKQGKNGTGIAPEDIEALVKYPWSPEQELYRSPPGKGGFNYAGMAHPEYFNRQYFAPSLYPPGTSASRRRNLWYGSNTVSEKDAGGDGKHLLLSWTSQLRGGFNNGIYQVQLAKVEFDTIPENSDGNFPSAAASSSMPALSLASNATSPTVTTTNAPCTSFVKPSGVALTSTGSADRTAQQPWSPESWLLFEWWGAWFGLLLLPILWIWGCTVWF